MTRQTQQLKQPVCRVTGREFYPEERQLSEDTVGVYCSECGGSLEVYKT